MPSPSFRADLEGLRGIAVALVVLFHAHLLGAVGGFIGVDAFYVLSGFLITGLLLRELATKGRLDLVTFYGRRARRILPAAMVAIVVILAAAAFIVAPLDLPSIAADATASGLFVGNVLFAFRATDYFASSTPSPFLHYWSLGVE
jgi:peptidoglycan/LPS O-acetylase OafA/YrhL